MAEFDEQIAEEFAFEPVGEPPGALLCIAGLEAEEQSAGGAANAFAGGGDQGFAAAGDAAGDGRLGGQLTGGMSGRMDRGLAHDIAGKVQAGKKQANGDCRPGHGQQVVERLQEADRAGIGLAPGLEFGVEERAIVFVNSGQMIVSLLDAKQQFGPGAAA